MIARQKQQNRIGTEPVPYQLGTGKKYRQVLFGIQYLYFLFDTFLVISNTFWQVQYCIGLFFFLVLSNLNQISQGVFGVRYFLYYLCLQYQLFYYDIVSQFKYSFILYGALRFVILNSIFVPTSVFADITPFLAVLFRVNSQGRLHFIDY